MREAVRKSAALLRNSGALTLATVVTAGLGFGYWWLAARLFPPEAIGRAAALLSVMGLLGLLGDSGLGTLLVGEAARYRGRVAGLVSAATVVAMALAAALGMVFVVAEPLFGHASLIAGRHTMLLFIFGSALTAFTMVVSQALLGTLNGTARMLQQVVFSLLKLGMIGMAALAGASNEIAILMTWIAGAVVSWILVDLATHGGVRALLGRPDFALLHKLRHKVLDHYTLDIALQAPGLVVPFLVVVILTPTTNAAFAVVWMLIATAAAIPAVMATVLFPVVRASPKQSRHNFAVSLGVSLLFSTACAVFVLVYSREILAAFNPAYPDIAGSSLRFLGFSLLGSTLKFHACTLARLNDAMRRSSPWFLLGGILELCVAVAGAELGGLEGLVVGWTVVVSIEGACMVLYAGYVAYSGSASRPPSSGSQPTQPRSTLGSAPGKRMPPFDSPAPCEVPAGGIYITAKGTDA
ncbi:lipopolysaccharide biosynthesis protein [Rhodopseudomonas telluris]|uniref:Lipopolysaccharide biosynthesis protein n=1 Tax=Rhodopseudomonas telluris TaxID=644215 RepID=A0ABV6EWL9_9BRAD